MQAAVLRAFGADLTLEEILLDAPGPGQVRVRIAACAICHSDIAFINGAFGGELPMVLGHEAAGQVETVGPGVVGLDPGDPVLVTLIRTCGDCPACSAGNPTSCHDAYTLRPTPIHAADGPVTQAMATGAFAEAVVIDQSQCVKLPEGLDLTVASLLACGVITGFGAVTNTARLAEGQSCAVIGAGGVGLNTIQGARLSGAERIVAVDISQQKLDMARHFGATDTILASEEDTAEGIRSRLDGKGVDFAFVTAGAVELFETAPALLGAGGAMVMVGMPAVDARVSYSPTTIAAMNQSLLGSRMGQTVLHRDIPHLIGLYEQGALLLDPLISGRYPFAEINTAIAATKRGDSLRNVLVFE